jgi:hypothetical protein
VHRRVSLRDVLKTPKAALDKLVASLKYKALKHLQNTAEDTTATEPSSRLNCAMFGCYSARKAAVVSQKSVSFEKVMDEVSRYLTTADETSSLMDHEWSLEEATKDNMVRHTG